MAGGSGGRQSEEQRVLSYLERLDAVTALVYSEDGLPVDVKGLERDEAEEVTAISISLALEASRRLLNSDRATIALLTRERDIIVALWRRRAVISYAKPGYGPSIARALEGRGPSCERCGGDLSLALVKCSRCGALNPYTADECSSCGEPLRARRCPYCGAILDPSGRQLRFRDRIAPRVHEVESS